MHISARTNIFLSLFTLITVISFLLTFDLLPFGLTMLLVPGPVSYYEASRQGKESPSLPELQLACYSSLVCGCPTQLMDGSATLLGFDCHF